jgi:hypothetical protein
MCKRKHGCTYVTHIKCRHYLVAIVKTIVHTLRASIIE